MFFFFRRICFFSLYLLFFLLPLSGHAREKGKILQHYQDWHVLRFQDKDGFGCAASTQGLGDQDTPLEKAKSHIFITWWPQRPLPENKAFISIFNLRAGFDFNEKATARLVVGNQDIFYLITEQNNAWIHPDEDLKILETLWRYESDQVTLTATSKNGRIQRELYSLKGFRDAFLAASKNCNIPKEYILAQ